MCLWHDFCTLCEHHCSRSPLHTGRLQEAACLRCDRHELATSQGHHPRIWRVLQSATSTARNVLASASDWLGGAPSYSRLPNASTAWRRRCNNASTPSRERVDRRAKGPGRHPPQRTASGAGRARYGDQPSTVPGIELEEQRPDYGSQMRCQTLVSQGARSHLPYRAGRGHGRPHIFCGLLQRSQGQQRRSA